MRTFWHDSTETAMVERRFYFPVHSELFLSFFLPSFYCLSLLQNSANIRKLLGANIVHRCVRSIGKINSSSTETTGFHRGYAIRAECFLLPWKHQEAFGTWWVQNHSKTFDSTPPYSVRQAAAPIWMHPAANNMDVDDNVYLCSIVFLNIGLFVWAPHDIYSPNDTWHSLAHKTDGTDFC